MFKMLKNQKGMTLVELLAVMVIVGIIAAISIPAIGNLLDNTRKDAAVATAQAVQDAARLYVTSNNIAYNITLTATGEESNDLVTSNYLESKPLDPNKKEYSVAKVEVTFDSNGTAKYKTTLSTTDGKYNLQGDALELDRTKIQATPIS